MSDKHHDPVHGVTYEFTPRGEDMYVETVMEPGGGLPKHFHPTQVEHWWAIDGEVSFHLSGEWRRLTPDDGKVEVPAGTVHGLKNESGRAARLGATAHPALDLEGFLTESAKAAREGLFMKGGIPKSLRGARWAASFLERYEDDVVMMFPPRFVQRMLKPLAR